MTQPNPDAGGNQPPAKKAKVGDIVAYKRADPFTGVVESLIGVIVRAAEKELPHLIRPLHAYAHEVDPADVSSTSSDDVTS